MTTNVVCVNAKNYLGRGVEYVNNLYRQIITNSTVDITFTCFTDAPDIDGYLDGIDLVELPNNLDGWYNKLNLFQKGLLEGRIAYFDLDTIIIDNIDDILRYDGEFALLQDFLRPKFWGSAIMLWEADSMQKIWYEYVAAGYPQNLDDGDQQFIIENYSDAVLLQKLYKGIYSYKKDCINGLPEGARICCFHGKPRPHEVTEGWAAELWLQQLQLFKD